MKLIVALVAASLIAAPTFAKSAPCRDAKGRFTACGAANAPVATTKDKNGRCHVASGSKKGQFTACPK